MVTGMDGLQEQLFELQQHHFVTVPTENFMIRESYYERYMAYPRVKATTGSLAYNSMKVELSNQMTQERITLLGTRMGVAPAELEKILGKKAAGIALLDWMERSTDKNGD